MLKFSNKLNSKQQTTLEDIFQNPLSTNLVWKDVENLWHALRG